MVYIFLGKGLSSTLSVGGRCVAGSPEDWAAALVVVPNQNRRSSVRLALVVSGEECVEETEGDTAEAEVGVSQTGQAAAADLVGGADFAEERTVVRTAEVISAPEMTDTGVEEDRQEAVVIGKYVLLSSLVKNFADILPFSADGEEVLGIKEVFQTERTGMVGQADRADLEGLVGMKEADMVVLLVGTSGKVVGMTTETQSDRAIKDISPTHPHCCSPLMHRLTWQIIVFPILCVSYLLWPDLVGAFFFSALHHDEACECTFNSIFLFHLQLWLCNDLSSIFCSTGCNLCRKYEKRSARR